MPNKTIYLTDENYTRLKNEENESGFLNRLLDDYYQGLGQDGKTKQILEDNKKKLEEEEQKAEEERAKKLEIKRNLREEYNKTFPRDVQSMTHFEEFCKTKGFIE